MCRKYYLPGEIKLLSSLWNTIEFTCFQISLGKKCFTLIRIFRRTKKRTFWEAASKETCLSLCLDKEKLFIQLFWPLSSTTVVKKNIFSVELLLPWKKPLKKTLRKKTQAPFPWKCAILLAFLSKNITCHILKI